MSKEKNKSSKIDKQKINIGDICDDMTEWPNSWAGDSKDIPVGQKLLLCFKDFIQYQIDRGRTKSTLRKYTHYLWSLGGEIIRDVNTNEKYFLSLTAQEILLEYISEIGGPYWRHAYDENDHDKYHSVCRLLYKFIKLH